MEDIRRQTGIQGEKEAAFYLESQGVRIIQKNFRCRYGEIDLIGWDGTYYLMVEVKYRSSWEQGFPAEAVDFRKQRKICRTCDYYRMKKNLDDFVPIRFDIIEIDWKGRCHWVKNAFDYVE